MIRRGLKGKELVITIKFTLIVMSRSSRGGRRSMGNCQVGSICILELMRIIKKDLIQMGTKTRILMRGMLLLESSIFTVIQLIGLN